MASDDEFSVFFDSPDTPPSPVYSHSEWMQANSGYMDPRITQMEEETQRTKAEIEQQNQRMKNQLEEERKLRAQMERQIHQLQSQLETFNLRTNEVSKQITSVSDMVMPIHSRYIKDHDAKRKITKKFIDTHCRRTQTGKLSAKDLSQKLFAYSSKFNAPIQWFEVKQLMTECGIEQYQSTGGLACYRNLEYVTPAMMSPAMQSPMPSPMATPSPISIKTVSMVSPQLK